MANPLPKIRWAIFITLGLLALAVRLPQLGERLMHTDESVNAYIIGQLLAGKRFNYDPQDRHGPALAAATLPLVKLQGAKKFSDLTESELRLTTVLAGTTTILLFSAGSEMFGFIPCLIAALLFAIAPLPVYYDRYFIHETLFVAATFGFALTGWRALKNSSVVQAALAGSCAALMFVCKETAILHFFSFAIAGLVFWLWKPRRKDVTDLWQPKLVITAVVVFLFVSVMLLTWFGQNWKALADLSQAIPNFTSRASGEGHEKPLWYYVRLLAGGWSGGMISGLTLIGFFQAFRKQNRSAYGFLALYAVCIVTIYSAIPYKTPWLALNFWLPATLFVGLAVESIWFASTRFYIRMTVLSFLIVLGVLIAHDTRQRVFSNPGDENNPYAYAHTSEDLLGLPVRLEELIRQNKNAHPRIAVIASDPWPLPWYLRKFSEVGFWQPGQEVGAADFFITSTDAAEKYREQLKDLRPEFFGARPGVLIILWTPK